MMTHGHQFSVMTLAGLIPVSLDIRGRSASFLSITSVVPHLKMSSTRRPSLSVSAPFLSYSVYCVHSHFPPSMDWCKILHLHAGPAICLSVCLPTVSMCRFRVSLSNLYILPRLLKRRSVMHVQTIEAHFMQSRSKRRVNDRKAAGTVTTLELKDLHAVIRTHLVCFLRQPVLLSLLQPPLPIFVGRGKWTTETLPNR